MRGGCGAAGPVPAVSQFSSHDYIVFMHCTRCPLTRLRLLKVTNLDLATSLASVRTPNHVSPAGQLVSDVTVM